MLLSRLGRVATSLLILLGLAAGARAQCGEWEDGFHLSYPSTEVQCLTVFDDGSGPGLYVGGFFLKLGLDRTVNHIARWDGQRWSDLAGGVGGPNSVVQALAVFDDGTGPALYAGGMFTEAGGVPIPGRLAKWNGTSWSAVGGGVNGSIAALQVHDDGSGPALYVGGLFFVSGTGSTVNGIARWNGTSFSALGTGVSNYVSSLGVHDDGSGPKLFVGGSFSTAGGVPASCIASWDGAGWSALGAGLSAEVFALHSFDDGAGPALYAGGSFTQSGTTALQGFAHWRGGTWSAPAATAPIAVEDMAVYGGALHAASPYGEVRRLGPGGWTSIGSNPSGVFETLTTFDDGHGPRLFAGGGFFGLEGTPARNLASWDGVSWSTPALGSGTSQPVRALLGYDLGAGPEVFIAGGPFAGYTTFGSVQRWDGVTWAGFGTTSFTGVTALTGGSVGGVPTLFAGNANSVQARGQFGAWSNLGFVNGTGVLALACYNAGTGVHAYAGGNLSMIGGTPAANVARWNGSGWSALGTGVTGVVHALRLADLGTGPRLYVGGTFTSAGGTPANRIASWNGTSFSALGSGTSEHVWALEPFDDGTGPALYVGGNLAVAGGVSAPFIARWNGTSWSDVGGGTNGQVFALGVYDDGRGPALIAGGDFTEAGGVLATRLARWDGSTWSAFGTGLDAPVRSLAAFEDAGGEKLFVGGDFTHAGGEWSSRIARWTGCGVAGTPYCFGDGSLATPCPCGNLGDTGRGCGNSIHAVGARLLGTGQPNPDTVALHASSMPSIVSVAAIFLQGDLEDAAGLVFGDGLRCADGNLIRLGSKPTPGGSAVYPEAGNLPVSVRGSVVPGSGAVRSYQTYYRNAAAAFCPPATFNSTNAVRIVW